MPALQDDDDATKEGKLKAALWYSVGQKVDDLDVTATPHAIGALSELVWSQIENVAQDLEAFAKNSNRSTISSKDVVLLGRRNDDLKNLLQKEADAVCQGDRDKL